MIHVEYQKADNYSQDRKILLFDRDAFQSLSEEELRKINQEYNVLCPQVFVIECIAPENTDNKPDAEFEKIKRTLRKKLELIQNPKVLTGTTNIPDTIVIFDSLSNDIQLPTFLASEQIAKNCITAVPIQMKYVPSEELIAHYHKSKIDNFKGLVETITQTCESIKGSLTTNQLISRGQRFFQQHNITASKVKLKRALRSNEHTYVSQELSYVAKETQREIENESTDESITGFKNFFTLTAKDTKILTNQLQDKKKLTVENYPNLAYPIYVYYLTRFIVYARQHDTQHLDQSYVRDFRYLHYLNFCDLFVTNEKSTPYIVNSLPYDDIRETPVITVNELKKRLN